MAVKVSMNQNEEVKTVTTPTTPVETTENVAKKDKKVSIAVQFANAGSKLRSQLTEDQKALEGIWSDKLYAIPLGAAKYPQKTVIGGQHTSEATIVGYKIKGTVDFEVEEMLDGAIQVRPVKAGEEVILTRQEMGLLASRPEVACVIGDKKLMLKFSQGKGLTPTLISKTETAMKQQMVLIDKRVDGEWKCLPEYEAKFGKMYNKARGAGLGGKVGTTSDPAKKRETEKNIAAGLRAYYNQKLRAGN